MELVDKNKLLIEKLQILHPEYSKHMFNKNEFVKQIVEDQFGGIDMIDRPICTTCQRPCLRSQQGAFCSSCGTTIPHDKIITLNEYYMNQLESVDIEQMLYDTLLKTKGR